MTTNAYFRYSKVLRRVHEGPRGVYIDIYAPLLLSEGHCYRNGAHWPRDYAYLKYVFTNAPAVNGTDDLDKLLPSNVTTDELKPMLSMLQLSTT